MRPLFFLLFLLTIPALGQKSAKTTAGLQSGPMLGFTDFKEAWVWVQTTAPATVQVRYTDAADAGASFLTQPVQTNEATAHVAKLIANRVQPGRRYNYEVLINGKKVALDYPCQFQTPALWQHRTDPPAARIALGSCTYINEPEVDRPGRAYGGDYSIFKAIYEKKPDAMIWLGDNAYLREVDWNSRTGIFHRYTHSRSFKELQPLLASTHHFSIWDDHDYGPNDADRSFYNKRLTEEAFNLFWLNPVTNVTGQGGTTGTFWWNDVQFFMMDDRWFRAPEHDANPDKAFLGEAQMAWLSDQLKFSSATFKVICIGSQVINTFAQWENYAAWPNEQARFLKMIEETRASGVLFLTGDRHHTVLSRMERPGNYPLYDLTCSPLTSGTYPMGKEEVNRHLVDGTLVVEQNFGVLELAGPRNERTLTMRIYDKAGAEKWNRTITAAELKTPKKK